MTANIRLAIVLHKIMVSVINSADYGRMQDELDAQRSPWRDVGEGVQYLE